MTAPMRVATAVFIALTCLPASAAETSKELGPVSTLLAAGFSVVGASSFAAEKRDVPISSTDGNIKGQAKYHIGYATLQRTGEAAVCLVYITEYDPGLYGGPGSQCFEVK